MIKRPNRILEIIWIITGILCIAAGIRLLVIKGYDNRILIFGIMAVISFFYAWFRHGQQKKS